MTGGQRPAWLVAGTTTAVRAGKQLRAIGEAVAAAGFTHVAVADADPGTIPAARAALDRGVPGMVAFVSPVLSWALGAPPPVTDAYPPAHVRQSVERLLADVGREVADVVLAHKWDPAWRGDGEAVLEQLVAAGSAVRTGVSCPDSHPGAAAGIAPGRVVCASWNVHDQALTARIAGYSDAGAVVLARAPLDHGALTGTWKDDPPGPHDWRARWWGQALEEARRRSAAFAATAHAHGLDPSEAALRFTLRNGWPHGTLVGVSNGVQAWKIAQWWAGGPLGADVREDLARHAWHDRYGRPAARPSVAAGVQRLDDDARMLLAARRTLLQGLPRPPGGVVETGEPSTRGWTGSWGRNPAFSASVGRWSACREYPRWSSRL